MAFLTPPTPSNVSSSSVHFAMLQICPYLCLFIANTFIMSPHKVIPRPFLYFYSHVPLIHSPCTTPKMFFLICKSDPVPGLLKCFLSTSLLLENISNSLVFKILKKFGPFFSFLRKNFCLIHIHSIGQRDHFIIVCFFTASCLSRCFLSRGCFLIYLENSFPSRSNSTASSVFL